MPVEGGGIPEPQAASGANVAVALGFFIHKNFISASSFRRIESEESESAAHFILTNFPRKSPVFL